MLAIITHYLLHHPFCYTSMQFATVASLQCYTMCISSNCLAATLHLQYYNGYLSQSVFHLPCKTFIHFASSVQLYWYINYTYWTSCFMLHSPRYIASPPSSSLLLPCHTPSYNVLYAFLLTTLFFASIPTSFACPSISYCSYMQFLLFHSINCRKRRFSLSSFFGCVSFFFLVIDMCS